MSTRTKRKHSSFWDRNDMEMLNATSEQFRIEVDRSIHEFLSDDTMRDYSFPSDLNNLERKHIHQKAAAFNLVSRSHGKDPNRIITIYKRDNRSNFESFYIDLTPESTAELTKIMQLSARQPSDDRPIIKMQSTDKVFGKLILGPPQRVAAPKITDSIQQFRASLPIFEMKDYVVEKIRENQVLIISSETGSGKSTQIPQYIMDDALKRGEPCRILCTQPRRISAVAVAERVSHERGSVVGENVGYHIRLESKLGADSNLVYCTNGVLIRSLMSGDWVLSSLTHIIIDEVHERDKLSDFLLICLRESIRKGVQIKLILMSATINVKKFCDYFQQAQVVAVPGRLFDIEQVFLDEVLELTGYDAVVMEKRNFLHDNAAFNEVALPPEDRQRYDDILMQFYHKNDEQTGAQLLQALLNEKMPLNYQHSENGMSPLLLAVYQCNYDLIEKLCNMGCSPNVKSSVGITALTLAQDRRQADVMIMLNMIKQPKPSREELLSYYYKMFADEEINYELLIKLIETVHQQFQSGAILVFLPGYDDIMICNDRLNESNLNRGSYQVFFLHGSMNIREQHDVFKKLPDGVRKIILSTNIAETSLTIDDVVYVIDSGKAKVQTYDSVSGLSSLQTQWISKACVKQRAGRAGRTQSGMCFHLFSRARFESFLSERIPEILRVPLEELCLNTKTLAGNYSSIYNFLVLAPDPPSSNTVKMAIENLECLGALDKEENLTPLGEYLSQLTIEPHLGKMLIYSVIFKCIDPVLTIVASLAQKDPFQLPTQANLRTCAGEKRKSLTAQTFSDHMVYLQAFFKWQDSVSSHKERQFCREYFISLSTMDTILKTRAQLLGQLRAARFVGANNNSIAALNHFADSWPLVKAVIASGLYPKLAFNKNGLYCTRSEKKVLIHNSSAMSKECLSVWLVYDEMIKVRNGHQVRGVTPITPITISMMCGIKASVPLANHLAIDEWLEFEYPSAHIIFLRQALDRIIEKKLYSPNNILNDFEEQVLSALAKVLTFEDRAANLIIPSGIKQKPRFFDFQRDLHNSPQNSHHSNINSLAQNFDNVMHVGRNGQVQQYHPHHYHHQQHHSHHQAHHQSHPRHFNQPHNYNGNNKYRNNFRNGNRNNSSSSSGGSVNFFMPWINRNNSVFLMIKVTQEVSVRIAQEKHMWIFSPQTEKQVISLDNVGTNVYLIFAMPQTKCLHGVARYVSINMNKSKPTAKVAWLYKVMIPYRMISHLRNSANNNRIVYEFIDGQMVDVDTAFKLLEICDNNLKHKRT